MRTLNSRQGQVAPFLILLLLLFLTLLVVNVHTVDPKNFFLIILGLIIFILAFLKIHFAIGILIFSMLLSPELTIGHAAERAVVVRLDDIFLFVIFIGWLARLAIFKELGLLKKTILNIPIRNYIFVCILATGIGLLTKQQTILRSFFYLLKYFEYFILYFLVVNNIETKGEVKAFIFLMILTCFIVGVYAIYSFQVGGERATAPFEGTPGEPNTLAGYLVIIMALCGGLLFHLKAAKFIKVGLVLVLCVSFFGLLFSLSRGGWLSFIFMYITMAVLLPRRRALMIFIAVFVITLAPMIFPGAVKRRFTETFRPTPRGSRFEVLGRELSIDESGSYRIKALGRGYQELLDSPIVGHGIPMFTVIDMQYARVMMETGLLGILTFGFLLVRLFKVGRDALKAGIESGDGFVQGISVGFLAGFVGLLIHAFSAASFIIVRIMEPFWFLTAIVVSLPDLFLSQRQKEEGFVAEGT